MLMECLLGVLSPAQTNGATPNTGEMWDPRSFRACQKGDEAVPIGEWVDVVFPAANATVRRDVQVRAAAIE